MFWMTGFFNPQGFITAMKQEVARAHTGWALDKVALHNDVTKIMTENCKEPPKVLFFKRYYGNKDITLVSSFQSGVYIGGLFLDGAGWNVKNCHLIEATNKVLYTNMPIVHIDAINSTDPKDPALYECPVYKKANRTGLNFITPLWLQGSKPPEHWVLRGVALLCDIK
jgi:dynein heavy chain